MYRAHFAFIRNPLRTRQGEFTSVVYGFLNGLVSLLQKEQPSHLAIVFDTPEPTFRHRAYADYKATRQKMPDDLVGQIARVDQVLGATGIPVMRLPGWEADDVIGTIAKQAEREGFEVFMVTGDKDYMQLVSPRVKMWNQKQQDLLVLGPDEVKQEFGVPPEQVVDVLALMGDSSDNIPGVGGIGPKTAVKLIEEYGSLDKVLESASQMKPSKMRDALISDREQALLSRSLATIDCEAPIEFRVEDYGVREILTPDLERLLIELELFNLLERLRGMYAAGRVSITAADQRDYKLITEPKDLQKLVTEWKRKRPLLSFDTETTSKDAMRAELVGASFATGKGEAVYVSMQDYRGLPDLSRPIQRFGQPVEPGCAAFLQLLANVYEDPDIPKTGQNVKYDMLVLKTYGIEVRGVVFDTILAAYLLNPGDRGLSLDNLARDYLKLPKIATSELIGTGKGQITMRDVPAERVCEYCCEDSDYALRLTHLLEKQLGSQEKILHEIEVPLIPALLEMEFTGVRLDTEMLAQMSKELDRDLVRITDECYLLAGESFNLNSPKQLAAILFDKLKLPVQKKTKSGPSTDVDTLTSLATRHELPAKLLEYRTLAKLKGTYVDSLPELIHPHTGRVHTTFSQTVAATGRLSSQDPNLQNIPIRTEVGRKIREAFVPGEPKWVLVSADYSQIELRIMAHLSGDPKLIETFEQGGDIHTATAAQIFNVPAESVVPDMRRAAKTVNFGIIYGQTDFGLSQELGIPRHEAKVFRENYFKLYPGVAQFTRETIEFCRKNGYVETILGRQRRIPDIEAPDRQIREFAERAAINHPVQGSAADMIKRAMIAIFRRLKEEKFSSRLLLQVHDELVFEAPTAEIERLSEMVRHEMQEGLKLRVPIAVEVGSGPNWLSAH
jgi:DNA polymerase-1